MTTPNESLPPITELLPNLGGLSLEQQRNSLLARYGHLGLIAATDGPQHQSPVLREDIANMRHQALTEYVNETSERTRKGPLINMTAPGRFIDSGEIFERLRQEDNQDRPYLLVRRIDRSRLEMAQQTGTDRNQETTPSGDQAKYEQQVMDECAISSPKDITYATIYRPDSGFIGVNDDKALLVYAPEALYSIRPKQRDFSYSSVQGLYLFVGQRLMNSALLATVKSE